MLIEPTRDFEIIRMWPRAMFQKKENGRLLIKQFVRQLELPGVYMLYRGDNLYYIGKATKDLFGRLHSHANKSTDTYYAHWDHFSAFAFTGTPGTSKAKLTEIEAILIAAMPTSKNRSTPRFKAVRIPKQLLKAR